MLRVHVFVVRMLHTVHLVHQCIMHVATRRRLSHHHLFIRLTRFSYFYIFTPYVALDSGGFTDPLFLALTACVMDRVPPTSEDVFPLYYDIDWVRVYEWVK